MLETNCGPYSSVVEQFVVEIRTITYVDLGAKQYNITMSEMEHATEYCLRFRACYLRDLHIS
jgi:hypothetical protein